MLSRGVDLVLVCVICGPRNIMFDEDNISPALGHRTGVAWCAGDNC